MIATLPSPGLTSTLTKVLKEVYLNLRESGKPIDFYCKIKNKRCHDLNNACEDCPLKQFQK